MDTRTLRAHPALCSGLVSRQVSQEEEEEERKRTRTRPQGPAACLCMDPAPRASSVVTKGSRTHTPSSPLVPNLSHCADSRDRHQDHVGSQWKKPPLGVHVHLVSEPQPGFTEERAPPWREVGDLESGNAVSLPQRATHWKGPPALHEPHIWSGGVPSCHGRLSSGLRRCCGGVTEDRCLNVCDTRMAGDETACSPCVPSGSPTHRHPGGHCSGHRAWEPTGPVCRAIAQVPVSLGMPTANKQSGEGELTD